jgi:hypothetical protein
MRPLSAAAAPWRRRACSRAADTRAAAAAFQSARFAVQPTGVFVFNNISYVRHGYRHVPFEIQVRAAAGLDMRSRGRRTDALCSQPEIELLLADGSRATAVTTEDFSLSVAVVTSLGVDVTHLLNVNNSGPRFGVRSRLQLPRPCALCPAGGSAHEGACRHAQQFRHVAAARRRGCVHQHVAEHAHDRPATQRQLHRADSQVLGTLASASAVSAVSEGLRRRGVCPLPWMWRSARNGVAARSPPDWS